MIQRFGSQVVGEGKLAGLVCMPWRLRSMIVLGGTMMVVDSPVAVRTVSGVSGLRAARGSWGTGP